MRLETSSGIIKKMLGKLDAIVADSLERRS